MNIINDTNETHAMNAMNLNEVVNEHKKAYLHQHSKSMFHKNAQKRDMAKHLLNEIDLNTLLQHTVYVVKSNTNKIYLDYPVLKHFAEPDNYSTLVTHFQQILSSVIEKHATAEIHLNLQSLTISAVDRYKSLLQMFFDMGGQKNIRLITHVYVYYTPHFIQPIQILFTTLLSSLIPTMEYNQGGEYYTKDETPAKLKQLLE